MQLKKYKYLLISKLIVWGGNIPPGKNWGGPIVTKG